MSNTFFMPGETAPDQIISEVEHGYYVCGHQIPSIAESRENFRISSRRVYEIEHGQLGQLDRSGSVIADSKRFFMSVDAVGNDLSLIAIPNCGKGQPMQVKRMSNGGPTLRSRAYLGGAGGCRGDSTMMRTSELKSFACEAAAIVARDRDVAAFEIYCASGDNRIARLNYTSDIPCRGVEELKSHAAEGFQIRIVSKGNAHEVGTANEAGDFSAEAVRVVLERAHRARIVDPHFAGF